MQIRTATAEDFDRLPDVDGTIESTRYLHVERSGAQRLFQRLSQEYESGIYNADVVNSADVLAALRANEEAPETALKGS